MKNICAALLLTTALSLTVTHAHAKSLTSIGDLTGGTTTSRANGVSGDGTTVLGNSSSALSTNESIMWTEAGGLTGLGILGASNASNSSIAATPDGSVIVGYSGGATRAYIWTQGGGLINLGILPGGNASRAADISADGTIVFGAANVASGFFHAMYWTQGGGMVDAGLLAGANPVTGNSNFSGVSADGLIATGHSTNAAGRSEAIRWTQGGGMVGLGFLGGYNTSTATGISADGTTIVGHSSLGFTSQQAFKWTQGGGMVGLGYVPGDAYSIANAVSGDGSIIVGNSVSAGFVQRAFRWTQTTGMVALSDYLTGEGIDITGWVFRDATGISDDGDIIVGYGTFGGNTLGYVANLAADAVINQQDLGASLNTVAAATQGAAHSAMQYIPQGLFTAENISSFAVPVMSGNMGFRFSSPEELDQVNPSAGGGEESGLSAFMIGGYGIGQSNDFNNGQWNGTMGLTAEVAEGLTIGTGVLASTSHQELDFKGESDMDALGGMAVLAYAPGDEGVRVFASGYAAQLSLDITRGYTNGGGFDSSRGSPDGTSYGGAVKVGYEKQILDGDASVTPYVEARYAKTKIESYTEEGGAFAASFTSQDSDYAAARVGVEFAYPVSPGLEFSVRPAWGHRMSSDGGTFSANVGGLSQSLSGQGGDRDWAEVSVGAKWQATESVRFSAELSGRTGKTEEPAANLMFGSSVKF